MSKGQLRGGTGSLEERNLSPEDVFTAVSTAMETSGSNRRMCSLVLH